MTEEKIKKLTDLIDLTLAYQERFYYDHFFQSYYDIESEELLDQKIKYIVRSLEENKMLNDYKDTKEIFELFPKDEVVMWD